MTNSPGTPVVGAAPTAAQIDAQYHALVREVSAWLVANGDQSDARQRAALRELRQIRGDNYVLDDLDDDVLWIRSNDLGLRLPVLQAHLDIARRRGVLALMGTVAASNQQVSESDAQFIELVARGLGLDSVEVTQVVMTALQDAGLRAA